MKPTPTGVKTAAAVAVMLAAPAIPAATASPSATAYASTAHAAPARATAPAAVPPGLSCDTGKHANDEYTGYALCKNDGGAPQTFWVHLVCGWAPDVDGDHVTLAPGQSGQSTAHCGRIGTGIGEIQVQP